MQLNKKKGKSENEEKYSDKTYEKFAAYYDQIYHDKNYELECNFIISFFRKFGLSKGSKILDLGCGTGEHSVILGKKGFHMTGMDISEVALEIAKKKAQQMRINAKFIKRDMSDFKLAEKFDACISMFSSLCYLIEIVQFKKTLQAVKQHLKPGGLLIFDYWNGNAVVNERPSTKVKIVKFGKRRIVRIATPKIDFPKQICEIEYHCIIIENHSVIDEFKEVHKIRYHFPADITDNLKEAGFDVIKISPINDANSSEGINPYLGSWYLAVIARKNAN